MSVVFSLSPTEVSYMPLSLSLFIAWFIFEFRRISCFISFENSKNYSCLQVVLPLVVHCKVK